jgi:Ca2+/Na+ antiporter
MEHDLIVSVTFPLHLNLTRMKPFCLMTLVSLDVFLAPSESVLEIVVKQMLQIKMQPKEALENEFKSQISAKYGNFHEPITDAMITADAFQAEANPPLIAWPNNGSIISTSLHVVLFPFKFLIHLTIPDVRCVPISKGGPSLQTALFSIFISILWLIPWTYIMVLCLETLGHAWHINDAIMGLTASAAGTAIPNYIASHVTATQGLSNMAISNAIGSNTFNILICLGLPWVLLTSVQGSYIEKWEGSIFAIVFFYIRMILFLPQSTFLFFQLSQQSQATSSYL